jgi:hypothetical protein
VPAGGTNILLPAAICAANSHEYRVAGTAFSQGDHCEKQPKALQVLNAWQLAVPIEQQ